jgi:hypothetical protein
MDTEKKFTAGERAEIMAAAHATLRRTKENMRRWAKEDLRRRDGDTKFITKTIRNARVPAPDPAPNRGDPPPAFLPADFLNEDPMRRYVREHNEQEAELARQRRRAEREWQRTRSQQVVPTPDDPEPLQVYIAPAGWATSQGALEAAVGEVIASERRDFQQALDKRDREIESLRREIKMLRDEVGLERGLTALKAELIFYYFTGLGKTCL